MNDVLSVNVLLFGPQAALAGTRCLTVQPATATVQAVLDAIPLTCPVLASSMCISRLAVNQDYSQPQDTITAQDELALIGMVSGG